MSIRKKVEWDGKKFYGFVNVGINNMEDNAPLASQALFFHLVLVNSCWKIPLGYFLVEGINGEQLHSLTVQCLGLLENACVKVASITFDGATSNISMMKKIGCNINDIYKINSQFKHSYHEKINVFLDPCHMFKLVRNTLHDFKKIICTNSGVIDWNYFELLVQLQEREGLKLGNKISRAHINYTNQKMKVKLAVQLMSDSVANSLLYCLRNKIQGFEGCEATIDFVKTFNRLFDIMNSRSIRIQEHKRALYPGNYENIKQELNEIQEYILSLRQTTGKPMYLSSRKTGFIGFLISIRSALQMYEHLVRNKKYLNYLPLYKINQDHIERLFGYIRSRGGHNNNPTAKELCYIYKKILIHKELHEGSATSGNAIPLDKIIILGVGDKIVNNENGINNLCPKYRLIEHNYEESELNGYHLGSYRYKIL